MGLIWCILVVSFTLSVVGFEVPQIKPELKIYNDIISLVPDSLVDLRMKDSLRDIVRFADKIFSRVDKPPNHPLPVNLGLLRLYAQYTNLSPLPVSESDESNTPRPKPAERDRSIDEELIAKSLHFYGYANEAYNSNPRIIQRDILLNNLHDKDTSNIKLPRHVVFLDHLTKSIVVSVRGTASISDMITDLYIEPYPFLEPSRNLFAHHGMAESAEALLPLVTAAITEIRDRKVDSERKYKDYKVVVTGHSLGAGTASLLTILLCMKSNISATAYAYAPPPTLSSIGPLPRLKSAKRRFFVPFVNFGRPWKREPTYKIYAFVHNNDIISRSSHTQILSLVSALSAVDDLKWTALERGGILLRNALTAEEAQLMQDCLRQRRHFTDGNDRDLYIAGDIYVLRPVVLGANATATVDRGLQAKQLEGAARNDSKGNSTASNNSTNASTATSTTEKTQAKQEFAFNIFGQALSLPPAAAAVGDAAKSTGNSAVKALAEGVDHAKHAVEGKLQEAQQRDDVPIPKMPMGNSSVSNYYRAEIVTDPRSLFNGLMYYGDAMVYDHLTVPFERALLQWRSDP